jgi:hypothetical protein
LSNADSFIEEVTDEVRRDRLFGLWKKYAPFVIGAIVAVVAGTAVKSWLDHRETEQARAAGGALLAAATGPTAEARAQSLLAFIDGAEGGVAFVARMQAAGALADAGDPAAAADMFDQAAGLGSEPALTALAAYRAAILRIPLVAPSQSIAALTPLTAPGNPMRILALEARGLVHLRNGDTAAARTDFDAVLADTAASEASRARVRELRTTLGPLAEG